MKSSYLLFFRHGQRVVGTDIIGRSNPGNYIIILIYIYYCIYIIINLF